jgi:hypothetical protein
MNKKLWFQCSAVAALFYLLLYGFLGYHYGYDNLWLIILLPLLLLGDIWGLRWWIKHYEDDYKDDQTR